MAVPGPKPSTHPDKGLVTPMPVAMHDYNRPCQQPYGSLEHEAAHRAYEMAEENGTLPPVPTTYACDYSKK